MYEISYKFLIFPDIFFNIYPKFIYDFNTNNVL